MIPTETVLLVLAAYLAYRLVKWLVKLPLELWKDYLAIMNIMRVRDAAKEGKGQPVTKWAYRAGQYLLFRAYIKDFVVNVIHLTLMLRELPRGPKWSRRSNHKTFTKWLLKDGELTVTERLQRHIDTPDSPHRARCLFLQGYWLSQYDLSGKHGVIAPDSAAQNV